MTSSVHVFWFRRDLRLHDNAGLFHALQSGKPVLGLFIFDRSILDGLDNREDARVTFIHREILAMKTALEAIGSSLLVLFDYPENAWEYIFQHYKVEAIYSNRDYESYAKHRDEKIKNMALQKGIGWHTYKDHVIFDKSEVLKGDGTPYVVFTPYSKAWKTVALSTATLQDISTSSHFANAPSEEHLNNMLKMEPLPFLSLSEMGFETSNADIPPKEVSRQLIRQYTEQRNFPAIQGTSKLGVHFRFGTISIREKARNAAILNETYLNELIWRDFYAMILDHFPHVENCSFRSAYDDIEWRNNMDEFNAWCLGETGYPMVDAGMRELNTTGFMHNRVRMVVASFMTKHLLIDWRWGASYFAEKLLDFDLASNSGGWQWAAGSGTDAAPYFRIFNPESQQTKFDKEGKYVKKWVPEWGTVRYKKPIVDHKMARERCLAVYKKALKG